MSNTEISFPVITTSLGRNGDMKTIGLSIFSDNDVVTLTPINTKGLGRCNIDVPNNKETLNLLIKSLQAIQMDRVGLEQVPFSQLSIGDQFNWPLANREKRKMVKTSGEHAAPKANPHDKLSFRSECTVTLWIGE
jgi:hypothetical protein